MPLESKLAVSVPYMSIPSFVFKSPTTPLADTPLFISAEKPDASYLTPSTYRSLSQRFAAGLRHAGFHVGDRVLLASSNSIYTPIVYMGTIMAGGIFVGAQATYDTGELGTQLEQTEPRFVLAAYDKADSILEAARRVGLRREALYHFDAAIETRTPNKSLAHWAELLADAGVGRDFVWEDLDSEETASRTASLVFSSGTSGNPKGVELTHCQLIAAVLQNPRFPVSTRDVNAGNGNAPFPLALCHMSLAGAVGQTVGCIGFAALNMPIVVPSRSDFVAVIDTVAKFKISALAIDPSFAIALFKDPAFRSRLSEMASVQALTLIGSPLGNEQIREFADLWKKTSGNDLVVRSAYGMTELGGGIVSWTINQANPPLPEILHANVEIKIMALDGLSELPDGEQGELWIRGPNVAKGYWRNVKATEEAFTNDRWLRTGDLARITRDKALNVVGRRKDAIKTRTGLIVPLHIEGVLLAHPDIKEVVVCGVPERLAQRSAGPDAEEFQEIRAYIVKAQKLDLTEQDVLRYLGENVPNVENVTSGVKFVERIPKTTTHKPMRRHLLRGDEDMHQA